MRLRIFVALVLICGLSLVANGARANGNDAEFEVTSPRSSEILDHIDRPGPGKSWLSFHLERIAVHKKAGLAYTRRLDLGERGVSFSVRGPAMGRKKRVGLSVELRF